MGDTTIGRRDGTGRARSEITVLHSIHLSNATSHSVHPPFSPLLRVSSLHQSHHRTHHHLRHDQSHHRMNLRMFDDDDITAFSNYHHHHRRHHRVCHFYIQLRKERYSSSPKKNDRYTITLHLSHPGHILHATTITATTWSGVTSRSGDAPCNGPGSHSSVSISSPLFGISIGSPRCNRNIHRSHNTSVHHPKSQTIHHQFHRFLQSFTR